MKSIAFVLSLVLLTGFSLAQRRSIVAPSEHLYYKDNKHQRCEKCCESEDGVADMNDCFEPKNDTLQWNKHKLTDESWKQWRDENQEEVEKIKKQNRIVQDAKV